MVKEADTIMRNRFFEAQLFLRKRRWHADECAEATCLIAQLFAPEWQEYANAKIAQKAGLAKTFWIGCRDKGVEHVGSTYKANYDRIQTTLEAFFEKQIENASLDPIPPTPAPEPQDDTPVPAPAPVPVPVPVRPIMSDDITDKIQVGIPGRHKQLARIKRYLRLRMYPFLFGSPGAGKSFLAEQIAQDMDLPFLCQTLNQDSTKGEFLGGKSPVSGEYFPAEFRAIWEHGGVVLLDECGLAPGQVLNVLNNAMAQRTLNFPDGRRVRMHENCFLLLADNSNLWGNDPQFPERNDSGSAFRDRLQYIRFEYDHDLERHVLAGIWGSEPMARKFHEMVLKIREILAEKELPLFASPRFGYAFSKLFLAGDTIQEALEASLYQGQVPDLINQVDSRIRQTLAALAA